MLENEQVFAAAAAVISIVDDERGGRRKRPEEGGFFHTLEGEVAQELYKHLESTFEHELRQAIDRARSEEIGMRLGHLDPRDLEDYDPEQPETVETMPPTKAEKLQQLLTDAIEELKTLRGHRCEFSEEDYCIVCGLDGRA